MMSDRATRIVLIIIAALLGGQLLQPYLNAWVFSSGIPRPVAARGDLSAFERSSVELFEAVAPSVVQVVAQAGGVRGADGTQSGTGFVWDAAGHIVTNNHVIQNANDIVVRLASHRIMPATVVGRAPNYDLAVLRIDVREPLPAAIQLGSSGDLKVGQLAYAIGNPFGLDQSLTMGIISALKRRLPTSGGREIADVIQTDAAVNPGNSGGPLLDSAGRLIGVNTAIFSPSGANAGIGFAIPADVANRIVPALIRSGRVPTPGIGVRVADETIAAQLGLTGIVIAEVIPGSPAERAGLRGIDAAAGVVGDVIIEAEGERVQRLTELTDRLEQAGPGGKVNLTVRRGAETRRVEVGVVDIGER
jgi:2-alkenal reductase